MFTQTWRDRWGLREDPFACEDADKDHLLAEIDVAAVHSGFDRIYGTPREPSPGIVFGEKGSGKSGLRRMMGRRLADHNRSAPDERVFAVEYIDFDGYFEAFRRSLGAPHDSPKVAEALTKRWQLSDHVDAILSLGTTKLVHDAIDRELDADSPRARLASLSRKQRVDLLLFTALYYSSREHTAGEAVATMRRTLGLSGARRGLGKLLAILLTIVGVAFCIAPLTDYPEQLGWPESVPPLYVGAGLVALTWGWRFVSHALLRGRVARALRGLRVLTRDPEPVVDVLGSLPRKERVEYGLPAGTDPSSRFELLGRFVTILQTLGYRGMYVLVDRVDEPALLAGDAERMRRIVDRMFDIKLLQFPGLGLKLFLPIELEVLHRGAAPEEMKRMRLDKSNLLPELSWSGAELYEVANQRIRACLQPGRELELADLFEDGFDVERLRESLGQLGTPRYAFGFLSALLMDYVRELPGDLADDDPRWGVPRSHFEVVRGRWIDKTGALRRALN